LEGYIILAVTIIALFIALGITRKEGKEHGGLSKKGIYKLLGLLGIVFVFLVIIVFLTPESWA